MAESCKEQQVKVEEEVLQPVDTWVKKQKETCENEPCNPWLLCLNTLVCWLVWVTVKVTEMVLVVVVRWVYRTVCVVVSIIVGLLALVFTFNPDILIRAFQDLFDLVKDAVLLAVGFVIYRGSEIIDWVLTALKLKDGKRKLTKAEIATLKTVFGDSLLYNLIEVNEGRLGIYGPPFATDGATTIGYTIYVRSAGNWMVTLVHECVHIWQFQFGGTHYIGQSAILQGLFKVGVIADPYDWPSQIGTEDNAWYLLESVEAQAEFIEDAFHFGRVVFDDGRPEDKTDGAFFRMRDNGRNIFTYGVDSGGQESTDIASGAADFTAIANAAWKILKTG